MGVEGYIRFQLCIPHKMIEPVEINGELTDIWPKFVKQDLSQEIVDWIVQEFIQSSNKGYKTIIIFAFIKAYTFSVYLCHPEKLMSITKP